MSKNLRSFEVIMGIYDATLPLWIDHGSIISDDRAISEVVDRQAGKSGSEVYAIISEVMADRI